ncbi:hypothetical protein BLOT_012715 [Blomia tropicalis]|nr:hypothetical protein BLOT_012715 [Blomia tropicalis]
MEKTMMMEILGKLLTTTIQPIPCSTKLFTSHVQVLMNQNTRELVTSCLIDMQAESFWKFT